MYKIAEYATPSKIATVRSKITVASIVTRNWLMPDFRLVAEKCSGCRSSRSCATPLPSKRRQVPQAAGAPSRRRAETWRRAGKQSGTHARKARLLAGFTAAACARNGRRSRHTAEKRQQNVAYALRDELLIGVERLVFHAGSRSTAQKGFQSCRALQSSQWAR